MTLFHLNEVELKNEWLDAYGHLNEAFYLVPMSETTWLLQDEFGIGVDYFDKTGCAIYTVETHLRYLNEVRAPAKLEIQSMILGSDAKRIWFAHQMVVDETIRATAEFMVLHYSTRDKRTVPMPEAVCEALKNAQVAEQPDWVSRKLSL